MSMVRTMLESFKPKSECVKGFRSARLEQFDSRFEHIAFVDGIAIATLLDPRFKVLHLKPLAYARVVQVVSDMMKESEKKERGQLASNTENTSSQSKSNQTHIQNIWDIHDRMVVEQTAQLEPDRPGGVSGELRNFLHQKVIYRSSDPLEAWSAIKSEYPHLHPIAKDFLSRMVTSVPAERMFSRTGRTCENRYRLNATRMAKLSFLSSLQDTDWFLDT
ncbi:zinc finger BED domain-containing protein 4-like [Wyeomyia smithii]|uniref:zinc finger BED domain-containing protein 4-like n=1 Tax=Wyeomyia smithii TaxID=174621 RepID=UPI00246801AB|nr:zinc finger BED domain-containing protein 4-like [Wyeomyia smithii]XP_055549415.1 zinc finger BED domain-containing protein 4-like [Wyeomyia smithii]XP_055549425.1 zinc finger BED domain-containing protein 4-like [Wyeomyia smithii]